MRWIGALLLCGMLAGCGAGDLPTAEVSEGEFRVEIATRGELRAVESQVVARPRRGWSRGQIVRMAPEGSVVEKGDFLIQFDTAEAERQLDERQNALENARAELASQKATSASRMAELASQLQTQEYSYEQARIRFQQMEYEAEIRRREQELELRKAELSLQEARDRIESQRLIDAANQRKAELAVEQATMELQQAQETLDAQTLTAPIAGLVVYKEIWKGAGGRGKVTVGDTPWPGQELVEIPDLSRMKVSTKVNEVDAHRVAVDQEVAVEIDALSELELAGRLSSVATLAKREGQSEVKSFDVEVLLEDGDERLRPGMTASCRILVERHENVLSVPLEAVFAMEGRTVCYVIGGGVDEREVTLGARNEDFVVVLEGLAAGERVSLRDPHAPIEEVGEDAPDGEAGGAS